MIAIYVKGMSTTKNLVITILEHGLSPNVIYTFMIPRGEIELPMNLVNKEAIEIRSLDGSLNFRNASK